MTDEATMMADRARASGLESPGGDDAGVPRQPRAPHDHAGRLRAGGGYGYVPWIMQGAHGRGEARRRPDREGRAAPRRRDVRAAGRPRRRRRGPRAPARLHADHADRHRRRHRHRAHHRRQARQHLLLPDRHLGRLHLLQLLHGPRGGHQLEDVRHCSYGPWVRAIEGIFKEEKFHIRHGEHWVKRLAGADAPTEAQRRSTGGTCAP